MPTELLFRDDAYLRECEATVVACESGGVVLDRTVFYAQGGGQPGDTGILEDAQGETYEVVNTVHGEGETIVHVLAEGVAPPSPGTELLGKLDWPRRYRHMRMHTGLHLLGAVLPFGVTGGNITAERSRLDFDMEAIPDKDEVNARLAELVARNQPVTSRWISDAELDAQPELVRTMSVQPPRGAGQVRLMEIAGSDLQPCGGTHVRSTGEVGHIEVSKVEKKGRHNRRVYVILGDN